MKNNSKNGQKPTRKSRPIVRKQLQSKKSLNGSNNPLSRNEQNQMNIPKFSPPLTVTHKEIIETGILASGVITLSINPGLETTFPWLANVANSYERYKFKNISFIYKPTCSASTDGSVFLCVDPNPSGLAPTSEQEMISMQYSANSTVWTPLTLQVPKEFLVERTLYVRSAIPNTNAYDLKNYDIGNFSYAVSNSTSSIGDLWVQYEIVLYNPKKDTSIQTESIIMDISTLGSTSTGPDYIVCSFNVTKDKIRIFANLPGRYLLCMFVHGITTTPTWAVAGKATLTSVDSSDDETVNYYNIMLTSTSTDYIDIDFGSDPTSNFRVTCNKI